MARDAVKLIGDHPYAGNHGTIRGGLYTSKTFPDWRMWLVALENGFECFAQETDLKRAD